MPEKLKKGQSKKNGHSSCSGCSKRTKAQEDLNEAELTAQAIQNNIESLKAQLEAQKVALKNQNKNIDIHRDRVSNESDNHSQSLSEYSESSHGHDHGHGHGHETHLMSCRPPLRQC